MDCTNDYINHKVLFHSTFNFPHDSSVYLTKDEAHFSDEDAYLFSSVREEHRGTAQATRHGARYSTKDDGVKGVDDYGHS